MKRTLINIFFEIPVYMTAGLGLISVVHLLFSLYDTLSMFLIVTGLLLGLLMWKAETASMKNITFGGNITYLKIYVYAHTLIIYILSMFGILELIFFFLGYPEIIFSEIISWKWLLILLPYLAAWDTTAELLISDAKKGMKSVQ